MYSRWRLYPFPIIFPLFLIQHRPSLKSTDPPLSSIQLGNIRQFGVLGTYNVSCNWCINVLPSNSNLILTVPHPIISAPVSPTPCSICLTDLNYVNTSHAVQMWDVVHESSSQSYFENSRGLPAMNHASFRLELISATWCALFFFPVPFLPIGPCPSFPPSFSQQSAMMCPFFLQL